jgi:hypothetical protein
MMQNDNINPKRCMYLIASFALTELGLIRPLGGMDIKWRVWDLPTYLEKQMSFESSILEFLCYQNFPQNPIM